MRQNSSPPNLSGCPHFQPGPPKHAPRLPLGSASFSTANQAQPSPRRLQSGSPVPGSQPLPRHTPRPESPRRPSSPSCPRISGVGASVQRWGAWRAGEGARKRCARADLRVWEWELVGRGQDYSFYWRLNLIFKINSKQTNKQKTNNTTRPSVFPRLSPPRNRLLSKSSISGPCAGGRLRALRGKNVK